MANEGMTIGQAAAAVGVNVETVRFYERRGMIEQPRKQGHRRHYSPAVIERLQFIRRAQHVGFSLREVHELLVLQSDPEADCSDVRSRTIQKLQVIDAKIEDLARMKAALETMVTFCPAKGSLRSCTILGALAG
jgi:MerR family mercuric resistance operon transcriptional regulator